MSSAAGGARGRAVRLGKSARGTQGVDVAIILPVYGHSILMCDALDSVLAQPASPRVLGIIVNDGCPNPETHHTCLEYATAYPDRFVYLAQANQGSAAARNTAIEWALRELADVEAYYFLDADNLLLPGAIAKALARLRETGADWIYPPYIAMGMHSMLEQFNPFSAAQLLRFNYIDTGSLVHRRVLAAGVRFDVEMKGFEDWEFWLSAVARGFRGAYEPELGLLYRKRPESQLAEHDIARNETVAHIRSKHKDLYHPASEIALAGKSQARYAVLFSGSRRALATSFVNRQGSPITREEIERAIWQAILSDNDAQLPSFYVWIDHEHWGLLNRIGLLPWLLVDAEHALRSAPVYGVCFEADTAEGELKVEWGGIPKHAAMVVIRADVVQSIVKDVSTDWIEGVVLSAHVPEYARFRKVHLPQSSRDTVRRVGMAVIDDLLAFNRSPYRPSMQARWYWRATAPMPTHQRFAVLSEQYESAAPLPYAASDRDIVFTLPFAEFGGADRVSYNMAHVLRGQGWVPHLVVTNRTKARLPAEFADCFETISFLDDPRSGGWGGNGFYLGTGLSPWGADGAWTKLWELVWFATVLVNNHSVAANAIVGRLKKLGTKTFSHLHLVDIDKLSHLGGHPMLALAYERGYTGLLGCSQAMCDWMVAQGAPPEKVIEIRNGPGFLIAPERAGEIVAARAGRNGGPLHVAYLGRLDNQKGLGALVSVHQQTIKAKLPVKWRLIGEAMVDGGPALPKEFLAEIEPPVFDAEDVLAVLEWADVLVLLSDYEGLPLVLIEAMLCGVVPVATHVGAIDELITHGEDGLLVGITHRERETMRYLELLCADRERLAAMSKAAHATAAKRNDWAGAVEPLLDMITIQSARSKVKGKAVATVLPTERHPTETADG